MSKKTFIYVLVLLCVILLLSNVFIDFNQDEPVVTKPATLSSRSIEKKFSEVLDQYNLDSSWVLIKFIKNENYDSLDRVYYVQLPTDISIPLLLSDINKRFQYDPVRIESIERKNYSNSTLKIYSGETFKMEAFLNHNRSIRRMISQLSIYVMINDFEGSDDIINNLLKMNIGTTLLLVPGEESRLFIQKINEHELTYAILINDDMDDNFKIEEDDNKELIKNTIVDLISVYGRSTKYIVDPHSELYNSVIFSFIRDEFAKRDIAFSFMIDYSSILDRDFNEVCSLFNFYCESGISKDVMKLIIDYNSFIRLKPLILEEKRKGTKFLVQ